MDASRGVNGLLPSWPLALGGSRHPRYAPEGFKLRPLGAGDRGKIQEHDGWNGLEIHQVQRVAVDVERDGLEQLAGNPLVFVVARHQKVRVAVADDRPRRPANVFSTC